MELLESEKSIFSIFLRLKGLNKTKKKKSEIIQKSEITFQVVLTKAECFF